VTDHSPGFGTTLSAPSSLSPELRRLLRRYARRVARIEPAESAYYSVELAESLRHGGEMKRSSLKRIEVAFMALVDAVIDLRTAQARILLLADAEGLTSAALGVADEVYSAADSDYAGYLVACTFDQVRETAAERRPASSQVTAEVSSGQPTQPRSTLG